MDWKIIGHEWAAHLLQQHIARQEVRHAYLFTGPAGVGRQTLALRFAQALNCVNPPAPGLYCGTCRVCTQIEQRRQPDLAVVQAPRQGGLLGVETIRELQRSLSLAPYEARYRVGLLLRFHEATESAQNALLKTLEEAPEKVILLLTASSAESLLPTIVSRCEVLRLRPLPVEALQASLVERGAAAGQAELAAHVSGGRPGYAVRLAEDPDLLDQRLAQLNDLWELMHSSRRARFTFADQKTRSKANTREERDQLRENLRGMLLTWMSFWRDVLLRSAGAGAPLTNPDQLERIDRLAIQVEMEGARKQVQVLDNTLSRLNNANLTLLMEVLLLDLPRVR